jgi:tetratricopeptide (TPR) repeat protein
VAHQRGYPELAVDLIGKAIARNSAVADFHCNFGSVLHALGRMAEAETHYRQAITLNPTHVESYNNFGNVLSAQGRLEEAQKQFRQALARRPSYAQAHFNLANALLSQGRTDEAIMYYQQAVGLMPRFPRAHFNLAQALQSQGKLAEAEASYRQTVALEPNWADAHRSLGKVLRGSNRPVEAEACYRRAYEIAPQACEDLLEWAELLDLLGRTEEGVQVRRHLCKLAPQAARHWFELGLALQRGFRPAEARDAYLRAQAIEPNLPFVRNNLAATYLECGQPGPAIAILETLIGDGRADALSFINLGMAYRQTFNLTRSVEMLERAIVLDPNNPVAYSNYSQTLQELQRHSEARAMLERALAIDPNFVGARWNLAMSQLLQGDYSQGWVNHEARWDGSPELRGNARGRPKQPVWQGEPLAGKTLLVWGEQGFGDALQFARYVPLIAERVKREGDVASRDASRSSFLTLIVRSRNSTTTVRCSAYRCGLQRRWTRYRRKLPTFCPTCKKSRHGARGLQPSDASRLPWCGQEMPPTSAIHTALSGSTLTRPRSSKFAMSRSIPCSSTLQIKSATPRPTALRSLIMRAK